MNLLGRVLQVYMPASLKRQKLQSLFKATSDAFGVDAPPLDHLSFDECLAQYALFTRDEIEIRIREGEDMEGIKRKLFDHAYVLGHEIRRQLHIKSNQDVMSVGKSLYKLIGIDFDGSSMGTVVIHSCLFSKFYSAGVCRIMSSLDEGIAAGLSGGGGFEFTQRITEGMPCCEGYLEFKDDTQ